VSEQFPRRGFLRRLCGLPLICGGLSFIGAPSAVAEPVTAGLMNAYDRFLAAERNLLRDEMPTQEMVFRARRSSEHGAPPKPKRPIGLFAMGSETIANHDAIVIVQRRPIVGPSLALCRSPGSLSLSAIVAIANGDFPAPCIELVFARLAAGRK
jgi:hypothetical protein